MEEEETVRRTSRLPPPSPLQKKGRKKNILIKLDRSSTRPRVADSYK